MDTCIISQILKQCDNVLADDKRRVWATRLNNGKGGVARYLVTDFRAFGLLSGIVRYYSHIKKIDERIFYRGQPSEWTLKPKLYRTCAPQNCNNETDVRLAKEKMSLVEEWKKSAMEIVLSEHFDFQGSDEEREAMAQHYGLATSFVDIVDHFQTALWFAYDKMDNDSSSGYVYLISVPSSKATLIDLRDKPSIWLRPQVQQAFCFKMNEITEYGKIPEQYHIMTFVVPKDLLRIWSNYDMIGRDYIYPPAKADLGKYYWEKAEDHLRKAGIGISPDTWINAKLAESGLI